MITITSAAALATDNQTEDCSKPYFAEILRVLNSWYTTRTESMIPTTRVSTFIELPLTKSGMKPELIF
ncbi:hypothetical protein D3C81_1900960 [compost metagenome]